MRRPGRWFLLLVLVSLALGACAGSTTTPLASSPVIASAVPSPATSAASSTAPSVAASLPPASGQFSFTGGISGPELVGQIQCDSPSLGGPFIAVFGQAADKSFATLLTIQAGKVSVRLDAGESTTYTDREFMGTGLTSFDAGKGVQVDSRLTETASLTKPGSLPSVASVKGSIDCGNQLPGSSTLEISGTVPEGALSGPIDPVRVECAPNAQLPSVHVSGVMKIGSAPVLVVIQGSATAFSLFTPPTGSTKQHAFLTNDPAVTTITATGAHLEGTVLEAGTPNQVTINGDVVCGTIDP